MTDTLTRLAAALADRYRIERELGQGGMATVYVAHDLKHHRDVAIKVMRPEVSAELAADRFLLEIRTTANLQHPHIVPVFDSGNADGQLFFVMPLIEGESLRDRLDREGPVPVEDAIRLIGEVAGALDYAHGRGILHRDLKPENIMLSRGHAMLADFGIARATRDTAADRMTRTGTSIGTPAYMSPEQATGDRDLGPSSDIYALGVILYEMFTGEPPFDGGTFEAILVKKFTQEAPRLRTRRVDVPGACEIAVARALMRDPARRFPTAREFAAALAERPGRMETIGKSIAVLPFANLSPDADNAYFADGLTEEVITTLSKVQKLRVISRTTMMQYRDRPDAVSSVARDLGVSHVLEGSVRKSGDRLRITASLIATAGSTSLWSERFDGTLADVFDIQDRVALAIVSAIDVTLSPEESDRMSERAFSDAEAYDLYLRAREGLNRFTETGVQLAFDNLGAALLLAPQNPVLLRGMGFTCFAAVNGGFEADRDAMLKRALGYADAIETVSSGSPFVAELRGLVAVLEGRAEDSLRDLGSAFDALPEDLEIAVWYGLVLGFSDHAEIQGAVGRSVLARDPDHPMAWCCVALSEMQQGNLEAAIELMRNAPKTAAPSLVDLFLVVMHLAAGDGAGASRASDASQRNSPDVLTRIAAFLGHAVRGDASAARALLTPDFINGVWSDLQYAEFVAEGFALLGDHAEAARWLDQAVMIGLGMYRALARHNAVWVPLLHDPDLQPVFERLKARGERYAIIPVAERAVALLDSASQDGAMSTTRPPRSS